MTQATNEGLIANTPVVVSSTSDDNAIITVTLPDGTSVSGPYRIVKQYLPPVPQYNWDGTPKVTSWDRTPKVTC